MAKGTLSIAGADTLTAADLAADSVGSSEIAASAVGSSEIADDAITPAKIAYLGDGTGKLSGTLTGQQLRLGTAFTLTDDLTVNGDLTLSKVRADGTGQSLTQDSSANRTLTGTGTLRMGHATEKTSISGFTGVLDSGVNLDSATFPAGHVVQVISNTYNSSNSDTITSSTFTRANASGTHHWSGQITSVGADNYVFISMTFMVQLYKTSTTTVGGRFGIFREAAAIMTPADHQFYYSGGDTETKNYYLPVVLNWLDKSPATGTNEYFLGYSSRDTTTVKIFSESGAQPFSCILMEVQQ